MKGENSMPDYLVHDGNQILNVVVAPSKESAETATGMQAIEVEEVFVLHPQRDQDGETIKDEDGTEIFEKYYGQIGWVLNDGKWSPPNDNGGSN